MCSGVFLTYIHLSCVLICFPQSTGFLKHLLVSVLGSPWASINLIVNEELKMNQESVSQNHALPINVVKAIKLADQISRCGGATMFVIEHKINGICVFNEQALQEDKHQILKIIYSTEHGLIRKSVA